MQKDDIVIVTKELRIHRLGGHTATCEYDRLGQRRFLDIPLEILAVPESIDATQTHTATTTPQGIQLIEPSITTPQNTEYRKYTCTCKVCGKILASSKALGGHSKSHSKEKKEKKG